MTNLQSLSIMLNNSDEWELAQSIERWLSESSVQAAESDHQGWLVSIRQFKQLADAVSDIGLDDARRLICMQYALKSLLTLKEQATTQAQNELIAELTLQVMANGRYLHQQHYH